MREEQVRSMVAKVIAAAQPSPFRFYHLCWWRDGVQCLHAHHTTAPHPIFFSMLGQVLNTGLSSSQWQVVRGRILYFCQVTHLPLDGLSARPERGPTRATS